MLAPKVRRDQLARQAMTALRDRKVIGEIQVSGVLPGMMASLGRRANKARLESRGQLA